MADRTIEIIVDVADKATGNLDGIKAGLLALDKAAQRMQNRLRAIGLQKYAATIRLIDRVTEPGSRINSFLKSMATKVYNITMRINDAAFGKVRQVEASLMRLVGRVWTIGVNLRDNVSGKIRGIADGMLMGAGAMGAGMMGTAGIGYGIYSGLNSYIDFERQMSRVQAVRGITDKNDPAMIALTNKAKEMGATTEWTRSEAAQAEYYMAMAGWDTDRIIKALPSVMHLASAGGTDLATTSDIVTDAMTGFGLKSGEMYINRFGKAVEASEHFADIMAKTVTSSNTNISQLGEAMKYSSNVIGAMYSGKDIQTRMRATEDALVMQGLMANAGIKGSMAGTATRAIFSRFGSENRNAYNALRAMGVDFTDQNTGEVRAIGDVMKDLGKRFKEGVDPNQLLNFAEAIAGEKIHADTRRKLNSFIESAQKHGGKLTGADMLKMSSMLAGQEAMSGLMAVLLGDWDALSDKIQNADGSAANMAKTMTDNLWGSLKILGSAWDAFVQDLFEGQAGQGLRGFVDTLTEVISRAQKLFSDGIQIGDFGKIIGDVIGRLKNKFLELDGIGSILAGGALMAGLMKITSTIRKLITYFGQLKAAEIGARLGATPPATGRPPVGVPPGASVSSMVVNAGSVVVNGRAVAGGGATGVAGVGGGGGAYGGGGRGGAMNMQRALAHQQRANENLARLQAKSADLNNKLLAAQAASATKWQNVRDMTAGGSWSMVNRATQSAEAADRRLAAVTASVTAQNEKLASRIKQAEMVVQNANRQVAVIRGQDLMNRYQAFRANATSAGGTPPAPSRFAGMRSAGLGGAAFAGIFGAFDIYNTRSMSQERSAAALEEIALAKKSYEEQVQQGASQDQLNQHAKAIADAQAAHTKILKENSENEMRTAAGAAGMIAGTAIGGALGSIIGPIGTMIGGMVGGMIGQQIGMWGADKAIEHGWTGSGSNAPQSHSEVTEAIVSKKITDDFNQHNPDATQAIGDDNNFIGKIKSRDEKINDLLLGGTMPKSFEEFSKRPVVDTPASTTDDYSALKVLGKGHRGDTPPAIPSTESVEEWIARTNAETKAHEERHAQSERERFKRQAQIGTGLWSQGGSFDAYKEGQQVVAGLTDNFKAMKRETSQFSFGDFFDSLFGVKKAAAAELTPEQLAQQAAMERGEVVTPTAKTLELPEVDTGSFGENLFSQFEAIGEGIGEFFNGLSESITESFSSAFEGAGEVVSSFGESIYESLASFAESAGEIFTAFGESITTGLTSVMEGAGEIFSGFGELVTAGLETASAAATGALETILGAFTSAKESIQSAWGELPGFFDGVFSGLGGAAEAAGSAIYSGLTSVIGAVIGAWESAAATVSGIISSIASAASSVAGMIPSFGGGVGKAEGGFVGAETHFFAGEHGPEVVIPLSSSRRGRALDLFEKTAAILGGEAMNFGADEIKDEMPELHDDFAFASREMENISDGASVTSAPISSGSSNSISMGGITINFDISGVENAQDVVEAIKENIAEISDRVAARLAVTMGDIHQNQNLST